MIRGEYAEIHKEERQGNIQGIANCPGKLQHRILAGERGRKRKIMHRRKVESIKEKKSRNIMEKFLLTYFMMLL